MTEVKKPKTEKPTKAEKVAKVEKPAEAVEEPKKNHNLILLGVGSILIAIATTTVSLIFYHNSGDIYLDRSRPGFLPDSEELEQRQEQKKDYTFSSSGNLTAEVIDEYLENYKEQLDSLDMLEKPFSSTPLSDTSLGISSE